ncbi:MAG: hypothetical protein AAGA25_16385 [Planctomycetota bacterium]
MGIIEVAIATLIGLIFLAIVVGFILLLITLLTGASRYSNPAHQQRIEELEDRVRHLETEHAP